MKPGREHVTIAVSGAHGGKTIDFRELAQQGMTLVGLTHAFNGTVATFQPNLVENLARGDENYLALLDAADAYIERNGLDLPLEPEARRVFPDAECIKQPILELDLAEAGITSIIWATGFAVDYSWLQVDAFDAAGKPQHQRGVSSERASTSSVCRGNRGVARRLSGACGTTPNTWPTISPSSVSTLSTAKPPRLPASPLSAPDHFPRSFLMPTHTRIRMFNTKATYPNQSLDNDLCQAVRAATPCTYAARWALIRRHLIGSATHGPRPSRR